MSHDGARETEMTLNTKFRSQVSAWLTRIAVKINVNAARRVIGNPPRSIVFDENSNTVLMTENASIEHLAITGLYLSLRGEVVKISANEIGESHD